MPKKGIRSSKPDFSNKNDFLAGAESGRRIFRKQMLRTNCFYENAMNKRILWSKGHLSIRKKAPAALGWF